MKKGRRSPVPTGEFTEIDCDTVIAAVGERVDSDLFTANGIEVNAKGIPEFRTNLENVFVGGDAMRGPATVVEGIADAQYFANAVIGSVRSVAIPDDAHATRTRPLPGRASSARPRPGARGALSALQHRLPGLRRRLPQPGQRGHHAAGWTA